MVNALNSVARIAASVTGTSNNYTGTSRFTDNSDKGDLRLDYQASHRDALFLRVSDRKENAVTFPRCRCRSMAGRMACSASWTSR